MQQTDKYKLNLIERDDVFSPDALNENTEKLEGTLTQLSTQAEAEAAARAAADADLDSRLRVFEARRFAMGTYRAKGGLVAIEITLDFTPKLVFIQGLNGSTFAGIIYPEQDPSYTAVIVENGFVIPAELNHFLNYRYVDYVYLAFG